VGVISGEKRKANRNHQKGNPRGGAKASATTRLLIKYRKKKNKIEERVRKEKVGVRQSGAKGKRLKKPARAPQPVGGAEMGRHLSVQGRKKKKGFNVWGKTKARRHYKDKAEVSGQNQKEYKKGGTGTATKDKIPPRKDGGQRADRSEPTGGTQRELGVCVTGKKKGTEPRMEGLTREG